MQKRHGHAFDRERTCKERNHIPALPVENVGPCASYALGLEGKPGVGKTHFVKNALAETMGLPVAFIALGGCTDASFLQGSMYTYEGSFYGRLASALIETKCSNPIIFIDELDKVSATTKGAEIINTLIHVTDPMQNTHIRDKYFGFDIDFSKCTFIFSFNDKNNVSHILLDRIKRIHFTTPNYEEKKKIVRNHLVPRLKALLHSTVHIEEAAIDVLVKRCQCDDSGMRSIEKYLRCIFLYAEIIGQCKDGGSIIGLQDVVVSDKTVTAENIAQIMDKIEPANTESVTNFMYM